MKNSAVRLIYLAYFAFTPGLLAQGLINFLNNPTTLISSNGYAIGGPPGTFRFELFIAPAGTLNPVSFTATGLIATNIASAGRLYGGNQLAVTGAPLGGTGAILVRGWSANLGTNYASALVAIKSGVLGYVGESSIAPNFPFGGDGGNGPVPSSPAFGGTSGVQSGFDLNRSCLSCFDSVWFVANPADASVRLGSDVTLFSYAMASYGYIPRYQWRKGGMSILGATNSLLTLTNVALSDSGSYDVVAGNGFISATSSVATLTVFIPAAAATLGSPGCTADNQFQFAVSGTAGSNYVVQVTTNLCSPTAWTSLFTNASPFTFVDSNAQNFTQRFYRAQAQ